jgi:hypothetical protein
MGASLPRLWRIQQRLQVDYKNLIRRGAARHRAQCRDPLHAAIVAGKHLGITTRDVDVTARSTR